MSIFIYILWTMKLIHNIKSRRHYVNSLNVLHFWIILTSWYWKGRKCRIISQLVHTTLLDLLCIFLVFCFVYLLFLCVFFLYFFSFFFSFCLSIWFCAFLFSCSSIVHVKELLTSNYFHLINILVSLPLVCFYYPIMIHIKFYLITDAFKLFVCLFFILFYSTYKQAIIWISSLHRFILYDRVIMRNSLMKNLQILILIIVGCKIIPKSIQI